MIVGKLIMDNPDDIRIVYNFNGIYLGFSVSLLTHPGAARQLADDITTASKAFWSSENEDWTCCMTWAEADEFTEHNLQILAKEPESNCPVS
jgi:hypothetical protein